MSVMVSFEGTCNEKEFDTSEQARNYINEIRKAGGYWLAFTSRKNKTEVFVPWHTIQEARIQSKKEWEMWKKDKEENGD